MRLSGILASMIAAVVTAAPIAKCAINGEAVDCDILTEGLVVAIEKYMESHATPTKSLEILEGYPLDCDQVIQFEGYSEEELPPPRFANSYQLDNAAAARNLDVEQPDSLPERFELKY